MGSMPARQETLTQRVEFMHSVLAEYRNVRRVYWYDHQPEDVQVLGACGRDLRPAAYSFIPGGLTFWLSGRLPLVANAARRSAPARIGLGVVRLLVAGEAFRIGWFWGSYKQASSCVEKLAALQTSLGGEIVAIIRDKDPQHPLLRLERAPPELDEQGIRPRIRTEANRLAHIDRLQRQLSAAKRGEHMRAPGDAEQHRLDMLVQQHADALGIKSTDSLSEYHGMPVVHDEAPTASTQHPEQRPPEPNTWPTQGHGSGDVLELVLGAGGGQHQGGGAEEGQGQTERRRRKRQWWLKSGSAALSDD